MRSRTRFEPYGVIPVGSAPEALGTYFRSEIERYAEIIRKADANWPGVLKK